MKKISLEELTPQLNRISHDIPTFMELSDRLDAVRKEVSTEGMTRDVAAYLKGIDPDMLPAYMPVASFTHLPSRTNLKASLEAIDAKRGAIIGAIVLAVAAVIAKIFSWILGGDSDSGPSSTSRVTAINEEVKTKTEEVTKKIEHIEEVIAKSEKPSMVAAKVDDTLKEYLKSEEYLSVVSEVTDELMKSNSPTYTAVTKMLSKDLGDIYEILSLFMSDLKRFSDGMQTNTPFRVGDVEDSQEMLIEAIKRATAIAEQMKHISLPGMDMPNIGEISLLEITTLAKHIKDGIEQRHKNSNSAEVKNATLDKFKRELGQPAIVHLFDMMEKLETSNKKHLHEYAELDKSLSKLNWDSLFDDTDELRLMVVQHVKFLSTNLRWLVSAIGSMYSLAYYLGDLHYKHLAAMHRVLIKVDKEYQNKNGI